MQTYFSLNVISSCVCYLLYSIKMRTAEMQLKNYQPNTYSSSKLLQKCTSMPSFTDTTNSSNSSIESNEDEYRKSAIKWILNYSKKIAKDTHYLAITYLNKLVRKYVYLSEENYQKVAITVLLIAAKMNEIYPPKITSMIARCKTNITKEDIITMQKTVLQVFDFDVAIDSTPFTHISNILGFIYSDKLEQCQKLLRIVAPFRQIYQMGDQILAYSIIYLIIPQFIRDMRLRENQKVKTLAIKIYNIYTGIKQKYDKQKQNNCF